MNTIVCISCAREKLTHRAKAEDLYSSDLFRKSLAYARQMRPAAIFILSAKYGVVHPDEEIDPYDVTLKGMSRAQLEGWSDIVFGHLNRESDVDNDHFVFLAGDKYRRYLVPRLRSVEVPMEGLKIGEQLQFLNRRLR